MEENPSGSYVLAKDITVPKNTCLFAQGNPFMGILDGKGHKIKGVQKYGGFCLVWQCEVCRV